MFQPISSIRNRNELALIYNSLLDENKLLRYQKKNMERQHAIHVYLNELDILDEELKKKNREIVLQKKATLCQLAKEKKEKEEREYFEQLVQVEKDVKQHENKLKEIQIQKTEINTQIIELEIEMKRYSQQIGLEDLHNKYNQLIKWEKEPIQTCCKHTKYKIIKEDRSESSFDDYIKTTCVCNDCKFQFVQYL
jgi:hypothetical protein